jgi:hypothetical protein
MIAALFVERGGVYSGLAGVDLWDIVRDARTYAGPWPVVAHPPCARWGRYWGGAPWQVERKQLGDDGGCFVAALAAVRRYGGVIEHPEGSHAWRHFGILAPPRKGGWVAAGLFHSGAWTCCVEQGWYGHRARKATWLYLKGEPRELCWGSAPGDFVRLDEGFHSEAERRRAVRTGACQRLSARQRQVTPPLFRDLLMELVQTTVIKTVGVAGVPQDFC